MSLSKIALTVFCLTFLTACGGGGSPSGNSDTSTPTTADPSPSSPSDGSTGDQPSDNVIKSIGFGSGTADDFIPGAITLSSDYSLMGDILKVSVDVVDRDNENVPVAQAYQFEFSSTCSGRSPAEASFSVTTVGSATGEAATTYRNISCRNSDNITVNLLSADGSQKLATATANVPAYIPQLGFGSGADFVAGKIEGNTNLLDEASTLLSVNAVDVFNLNSIISSDNYIAQWSASCSSAKFSIDSQSLSTSSIVTRYDANTCTGKDTVTVKLFAKNDLDTVLNSTTLILKIGSGTGTEIEPKLGIGSGSDFNLGQLQLNKEYVLAGGSASIVINGVNTKDNNALLQNNYLYKFESSCASSRFSASVVASSSGVVTNTYFNDRCEGEDTVTVSLFAQNADVNSDAALTSASSQLITAMPKLGQQSRVDFIEGIIEGNLNLLDEPSTFLAATAIDPMNVNIAISSSDYYIEWTSECATSHFSIKSQNLSSPIATRYDGDAVNCSEDTITLTLFNNTGDELGSMSGEAIISKSLVPPEPALGTGTATDFMEGELGFSQSDISARQTIEISINIVDKKDGINTLIADTEYAVEFNSVCATDDRATFDQSQVRTTSGIARVYYTASGCTGSDTVNAVLYEVKDNAVETKSSVAVASGTINIELPEVNSIEYQDMTSRKIALQGISFTALPEVTSVFFVVKDEFNQPISGKEVTFSLSNNSVDATLSGDSDGNGEVVATTNSEGIVAAHVNSGQTHGSVSVLAITEKNGGGLLRTQSFGISITTGIPVQPSFSLALDIYNPRGWNSDGETVYATVQVGDRFHNAVPDGTIVNFIADGGLIEPTCETVNGVCFVGWRSANPRPGFNKDTSSSAKQKSKTKSEHPTNDISSQFYFNGEDDCDPTDLAAVCNDERVVEIDPDWNGGRSGIVTIVAYLEGEVDFADANGNGRFDDGEDFYSMAEAYLDANEDGVYTAPDRNNPFEQLIEYDDDGVLTPAPSVYQGGSCTEAARLAGHCSSLVHIRKETQLVMSSDNVAFKLESIIGNSGPLTVGECVDVYDEGPITFNFLVNDYNGNTPIAETELTFEAKDLKIDKLPNPIANRALAGAVAVPITVRSDNRYGADNNYVTLSAADPHGGVAGSITVDDVVDDPRIFHTADAYFLDVSDSDQTVTYTFKDACGRPPKDDDAILFEMTNGFILSGGDRVKILDIRGDQLTEAGSYEITFTKDGISTVGELSIKTINATGGSHQYTTYDLRD